MRMINSSSNILATSGGADHKIWLYNCDKEAISQIIKNKIKLKPKINVNKREVGIDSNQFIDIVPTLLDKTTWDSLIFCYYK